ncbi:MAG: response regulator transcription factor [Balneolaceae bacterium]
MSKKEFRVYIVDDHPLMRKGMAMTLQSEVDIDVCGQAETAEKAIGEIGSQKPDAVIVDISLPGMNGIELVKSLIHQLPHLKILVVSRHDEDLYAERAIRAGAKGYLMKLEAGDTLVTALRKVLNGGLWLSEEMGARMIMKMAGGKNSGTQDPIELLSDRELEVFEHIGRGDTTAEIGERLHISVKTVESYRARIKDKLQLDSGNALLHRAVKWIEERSETR